MTQFDTVESTTIQQEVAIIPKRWIMLTNLSSVCIGEQSHKFAVVQSRLQTKQPNQTTLVFLFFRFKKSSLVLLKALRNGRRNWALVPSPRACFMRLVNSTVRNCFDAKVAFVKCQIFVFETFKRCLGKKWFCSLPVMYFVCWNPGMSLISGRTEKSPLYMLHWYSTFQGLLTGTSGFNSIN